MNKDLSLILRNMHDDLYHLQRNGLQSVISTYQDIYGGVQSSLEKWLLEPTEENWIVFTRQADIMERSFPKIDLDGISMIYAKLIHWHLLKRKKKKHLTQKKSEMNYLIML